MRKIIKGTEPEALTKWKSANNPNGRYIEITHVAREAIRETCTIEQYYLCAYCCQRISGQSTDTINEHVTARQLAHHLELDFSNIVASCATPDQCDNAHGSQPLPITPLMDECESELQFKISGRVEGLTENAKETIKVLNLGDIEANNKALVYKRKAAVQAILFTQGLAPSDPLEDDDLVKDVVDTLTQPVNGQLEPYAPVVVNIVKQWLADS